MRACATGSPPSPATSPLASRSSSARSSQGPPTAATARSSGLLAHDPRREGLAQPVGDGDLLERRGIDEDVAHAALHERVALAKHTVTGRAGSRTEARDRHL